MSVERAVRPGGRSARIQAAVHDAVEALIQADGRDSVTVPLVAAKAGVTPSTIYRRWGTLDDLLADVAVHRLRPEAGPPDAGTLRDDLYAWAETYAEEINSVPGRGLIRDVMASGACGPRAWQCSSFTREQLETIRARAVSRGEIAPDVDALLDHIVAPLVYRVLYTDSTITPAYCRLLVERALG